MRLFSTSSIVFFCVTLLAAVSVAQQPMQPPGENPAMMQESPDRMANCQAMMQKHQQMMEQMAAMDRRLQDLVAEMNRTSGSRKADKIAAVVNELVMQRAQMRDHMMQMVPQMMPHMMQHMQSGMMKGMMEGMAGCPMMKEMKKGQPQSPEQHH